ncbi:MAG: hypothetical protein HZB49_04070 [Bradyrhizobium sp.]|nr:hypothetical protein [Bradyrhizobium sp.]
MSETIDQKAPLGPNDPAYYAPRVPRDAEASRLPRLGETRAFRPPATSITDTSLDGQLENAVRESLRHPLDPETVEEPPELDRRGGLLGVVGRFAAAVGAAAFVALLFVIVIPSLRQQPSAEPSAAELIDSMKAAISRSEQVARPREPQPSQELQPTLASSEGGAPVSHQETETLLKQFMQWQQRPAETQEKN